MDGAVLLQGYAKHFFVRLCMNHDANIRARASSEESDYKHAMAGTFAHTGLARPRSASTLGLPFLNALSCGLLP